MSTSKKSEFDTFGKGDWIAEESIEPGRFKEMDKHGYFGAAGICGKYIMRRVEKGFELYEGN